MSVAVYNSIGGKRWREVECMGVSKQCSRELAEDDGECRRETDSFGVTVIHYSMLYTKFIQKHKFSAS